jgi:sulfoxide reductase heme-binding subunit YedZ
LRKVLKPAVWIGGLAPLAIILFVIATGQLEKDPVKDIEHRTGEAVLQLMFAALAVTPVRRLIGWNWLIAARRPLGLFAFFYAVLHFLIYLGDQGFAPGYIVEDVVKHPYVTVGFAAFCILVALAVTSTKGAIRRMGKRWVRLHRLVYAAAVLGVIHYLWSVKKDIEEPLMYGAVLAVILAFRIPIWREQRRKGDRPRSARLAASTDAAA